MSISQTLPSTHTSHLVTTASPWRGLYRAGGAAALAAGLLFRRNIAAEVSLFSPTPIPDTVEAWFALLQANPWLGMAYLSFFDLLDYALCGLMFLALYAALRKTSQSSMTIALPLALAGMAIYCASNPLFSMIALSQQYAAAAGQAQRTMLLAAGQAVLALNPTGVGHTGTGIYMSFLFLALAGLLSAAAMLRSGLFSKATAYTGILASAIDLTYCLTFASLPGLTVYLMSSAGLLLMVWHILVGLRLLQLARQPLERQAVQHG